MLMLSHFAKEEMWPLELSKLIESPHIVKPHSPTLKLGLPKSVAALPSETFGRQAQPGEWENLGSEKLPIAIGT